MNELKAIGRLLAEVSGAAVPVTRERVMPLSTAPLILIPIHMAGESPSLFALGVGRRSGRLDVEVCCEPRDREEQYAMLERACGYIQEAIDEWDDDHGAQPQIITSSSGASKLTLAVVDRMAFTQERPLIRQVGRTLYILDRSFERPDSGMLLDMPSVLTELYATGQDEHADQHLGALLEWFKEPDGSVYERVRAAELDAVSSATDPELDNLQLDPRLSALRGAKRAGDQRTISRLEAEIREIFVDEVERRFRLIVEALEIAERSPASDAARVIQAADRRRFDDHKAYASGPDNLIARGLRDDFAVTEFIEREFLIERVEGLQTRSVSGHRGAALMAGEIVVGEVLTRTETQRGRARCVEYEIRSSQDRLTIRPGDDLVLTNGTEEFGFKIRGYHLDGDQTIITAELTSGKTKPGQPLVGDEVELGRKVSDEFRIVRAMGIARRRLRERQTPPQVAGPVASNQDLLSIVRTHRRG
jgi:hypothetical protein